MAYTKHNHPLNDGLSPKVLNEMEKGIEDANKTATTTTLGLVKQSAAVADVTGDNPTKAEFNGLLTALRTAGIIAPSA